MLWFMDYIKYLYLYKLIIILSLFYIMIILIIVCFLYLLLFNYNIKNIIIFITIFTIIYLLNKCMKNYEYYDIVNVSQKDYENYNKSLFEYLIDGNKMYIKIKPINFVINIISNLSYDNILNEQVETFIYPFDEVLGAQITYINDNIKKIIYSPRINLINNYGIIINSNNEDNIDTKINCNIIAYGLSK